MLQSLGGGSAGRIGRNGRRALVVAADSGLAEVLRDVLRENGFRVSRLSTAEAAEARLCEEAFDLVVVEHAGTTLDAAELTLRVRRNRECPSRRAWVLVLGRELAADELFRLRDAGVSAILTGMFTVERIVARLRSMDRDNRQFVDTVKYVGPDRRFRGEFYPPEADRRNAARAAAGKAAAEGPAVETAAGG